MMVYDHIGNNDLQRIEVTTLSQSLEESKQWIISHMNNNYPYLIIVDIHQIEYEYSESYNSVLNTIFFYNKQSLIKRIINTIKTKLCLK